MDRSELDAALAKIDVEHYLDREGIDYTPSYGTKGLQLNLHECPACHGNGKGKTYLNAETGLGNCFHGSCGVKFNKFKLIRAVSGLSGVDLDEHITGVATELGWLPKKVRKEIVRAELKLPSKLHAVPIEGKHNLQYLQERGITIDTAAWFHLSYCHGGWWGYKTESGEEKWVSFDKRIIIPILDLNGAMVSFQGRDVTGEKQPKYLFPNGYAVSGSHLYNGHNFDDGVHTHLIVSEGAFGVFAIHQALREQPGCEGMLPIATFGMHLSGGPDGQIAKFAALKERGLKTVTMMWDSEKNAMALAVKMGLQLAGMGLTVRVARLPSGYDPADYPDPVTGKKRPTPPALVRDAIYQATTLNRMSAIRLLQEAMTLA